MHVSRLVVLAAALAAAEAGAQTLVRPDSPSLGPAAAPVTVVLFCDFQCEHCGEVSRTADDVSRAYGGSVRFVYRHFPLSRVHPEAEAAAEAAACAHEQGRFWDMYRVLYNSPSSLDWQGLRRLAREAGLDGPVFDRCLQSGRHVATRRQDVADATAAGVTGTPTFFVNGQMAEGVEARAALDGMIRAALAGPSE